MKNHKLLTATLLLLLGTTFFLTSCGEDEDEITLIGTWKVTSAVFNPAVDVNNDSILDTDAYSFLFSQPCNQDDVFVFEEGGVFKNDEGATKCDPTDPQFEQGTYTQAGATVTVYTQDTIVFNNTVISKSNFTGTVTFDFGGGKANVNFVMERQ